MSEILDYGTESFLNGEMLIVIFAVMIGFFLLLAFLLNSYIPFREERDYIKMEMERSYDEKEYLHWKRKLKMLYISRIPIVRSIVKRKYK